MTPAGRPVTHFERLGLPARFDLDPAALEQAFLRASRAVHPDHHPGGQDDTAAVNAAHQAVRDPLRRAEYLLTLHPDAGPASPPDPTFLMDMMDLRERLEVDPAGVAGDLSARLAGLLADLGRQFPAGEMAGVRRTLAAAKTVRSLLREAEGA